MLSLPGPRTALAAAGALAVLVVTAAPLPALTAPEDDLEAAQRRANRAAAGLAEAEEQLARASDTVARVETRVARIDSRTGAVSRNAYFLAGDDGHRYFGAHLDSFGASGRVGAGTQIGTVGDTGDASGGPPHLHLEIHPGGTGNVNPFPTLSRYC